MRSFKVFAASLALMLGLVGTGHAQNVVPGGWSAQFGYHALGATGQGAYGSASSYNGWNSAGTGGVVVGPGFGQYVPQSGYYPQPPRMVNNLGPLGGAIGRTTRARRSR